MLVKPQSKHLSIFLNRKLFSIIKYVLIAIDHIRILSIGLELPCNGGSCGGIYLKVFAFEKILPHWPPLHASSSPILRIRIWSIEYHIVIELEQEVIVAVIEVEF